MRCQLLDVAQNQTGRISEHGGGTPPRQCRRDGCSRVLVRSDRNLSTARRPSRSAVSTRPGGRPVWRARGGRGACCSGGGSRGAAPPREKRAAPGGGAGAAG